MLMLTICSRNGLGRLLVHPMELTTGSAVFSIMLR